MNNSEPANKAFTHFFGAGGHPAEDLHSVSIGNGQASAQAGPDTTIKYFDAQQYRAPADPNSFVRTQAADGSTWYKQQWKDGDTAPRAPERL